MKLGMYLELIRKCPDGELTNKFGVYDNWPIFMNTDPYELAKGLCSTEKFSYEIKPEKMKLLLNQYSSSPLIDIIQDGIIATLNHDEGGADIQVINNVKRANCRGSKEDIEAQMKNHAMSLLVHPGVKVKKMTTGNRIMANVIIEIGRYAQKKRVPLCFPNSRGWDNPEDNSRIVYYDPNDQYAGCVQPAEEYLSVIHDTVIEASRNPESKISCGIVALKIIDILMAEGHEYEQNPHTEIVFKPGDGGKKQEPFSPVGVPDITMYSHIVPISGGLVYEPLIKKVVPREDYLETAFGKEKMSMFPCVNCLQVEEIIEANRDFIDLLPQNS